MSELFIAVERDEDVDVLLADLIRTRGFHVTTTREAGNLHANDAGSACLCDPTEGYIRNA